MNTFSCNLTCIEVTIIDDQLILLAANLQMFHWNEMPNWWLPCSMYDSDIYSNREHSYPSN